ncbi:MAG TPA: hypothetical protein VNO30_12190 [Kofleriaceae bacterium]|nr:hypothetical protein [Kofleriaceae bacterium]
MRVLSPSVVLLVAAGGLALGATSLAGCPRSSGTGPKQVATRAVHRTKLAQLNDGPCEPKQRYVQEPLREPMKIGPVNGQLETELVVAFRERCVPVWIPGDAQSPGRFEMQTMFLRTFGFPRDPDAPITETDADDRESPKIAWSSPGPTFVVDAASQPGAADGTRIKLRLYNRMPFETDPHACVTNIRCNTKGPNAGADPISGRCKQPIEPGEGGSLSRVPSQRVDGKVIEPPNCFHSLYSTNLHFHGFHISPQAPQDNVGLELRPPPPKGLEPDATARPAGGQPVIAFGHYDYAIDPLRYTQAPGTHWYHPHSHGSTALHVLNGQVGTFEVRGDFDRGLDAYFATKGGGALADRLLVVQQIQERLRELGGADPTPAVLVNGQANPIVAMKRGEIQRWRFVGATMQPAAALRLGFPDLGGKPSPEVRQIAMDGIQLSPDNYECQPFIQNPDCTPPADDGPFDEKTAFPLAPGSRVDVLVKAPDTAGTYCLVLDITARHAEARPNRAQHTERAALAQGACGGGSLGPLLTVVVEGGARPMTFPARADFPPLPPFLADLPPVTEPARQRAVHYEMADPGAPAEPQFFVNQSKFDGSCVSETLTVDVPEQWTLWNNSLTVAPSFHIPQNPFQLRSQSDRGTYKHPVWRDVLPIPMAKQPGAAKQPPAAWSPSGNPQDANRPWGSAVITYVAREFTGGFVHYSSILLHRDRGMMQGAQATCASGGWATTGPVPAGARCDAAGFCPGDCQLGTPGAAAPACPAPPQQQSNWPSKYGAP